MKSKFAVYGTVTVAALVLLHTLYRQTTLAGGAGLRARAVEMDTPHLFSEPRLAAFLETLRDGYVEEIHATSLGTFGARKGLNKVATLGSGEKVLMKERGRHNLQGELFSYHLNCYLDLWNAPPIALGCLAHRSDGKLVLAAAEDATVLRNESATCFTVAAFVEGMRGAVYLPPRASLEVVPTSSRELSRLLEWSDLVLFDFLTGHSDRLVDNNFQLLPRVDFILSTKRVPNLARASSGQLLLIDHETTFHLGYARARESSLQTRRQYHHLDTVFVFRRRTVERLCGLCVRRDPAAELEDYVRRRDPISLQIASTLEPEDRTEFRGRLTHACSKTCHLLESYI